MSHIELVEGVKFEFTIPESGGKYNATVRDASVIVSWIHSVTHEHTSTYYQIDTARRAIMSGDWVVISQISDAKSAQIYQVGFADGTWRDVPEETFNEVKTWPGLTTRVVEIVY